MLPAIVRAREIGPSNGYASGDWIAPFGAENLLSARTLSTSARFFAFCFLLPRPLLIVTARIFLTTAQASAAMRAGFYTNLNGVPNALIADLGEVDMSTGGGADKDWTASSVLSGHVWLVLANKNVATGISVPGPSSGDANPGFSPVTSDFVSASGSNVAFPWMSAAVAYPGSMPATCPALDRNTASCPFPILEID